MNDYCAVDLFAGGGGLTVGLKRAGFKVTSAVELNETACATYRRNHPEVHCHKADIRDLGGADILKHTSGKSPSLLAGCPPCQGFSSLTHKYRREDPRNGLISEMLRLIIEVRPKTVMLENVPGMTVKGKLLFENFLAEMNAAGYRCEHGVLDAADFGVPQTRKRLVFVAGLGFEVKLPIPTHSKSGLGKALPRVSVGSVLCDLGKAKTMSQIKEEKIPESEHNWHVVRNLSEANRMRLEKAVPGKSWKEIPEKLRPKCHQNGYKGFSNVYGRMDASEVAPTITGGCTTLSKGRFGHPTEPRTISVREAARIQTFPDEYVFETPHMDAACNIVGNAFPCLFARRIAESCLQSLEGFYLSNRRGGSSAGFQR